VERATRIGGAPPARARDGGGDAADSEFQLAPPTVSALLHVFHPPSASFELSHPPSSKFSNAVLSDDLESASEGLRLLRREQPGRPPWDDAAAPLSGAHLQLFGRKKKSQNKNFDDLITTI
jgi:hypothetical protein